MRAGNTHGCGDSGLLGRTQWWCPEAIGRPIDMSGRMRKLAGTIAFLLFLGVYILIAAAIGAGRISEANGFVQGLFNGNLVHQKIQSSVVDNG